MRAEHQEARELAIQALSLAQQAGDLLHTTLGHWYLGTVLLWQGDYTPAQAHLERMTTYYEPEQHRALVLLRGSDAGPCALAYEACCLWCLGYPEQAQKHSQEALVLGRELGHPLSLAIVLLVAGCLLDAMRCDGQALVDHTEELMALSQKAALQALLTEGASYRGETLVMLGQGQAGIAELRQSMAVYLSDGGKRYLPGRLGSLAKAQAKTGYPEEGLVTLSEALDGVEKTGEYHWKAELHRLRGELQLLQGDEAGADASLQEAIKTARRQRAKSWELRAATSLARLCRDQGRKLEARELLLPVLDWFTEGYDTRDLKEARSLLDELSWFLAGG